MGPLLAFVVVLSQAPKAELPFAKDIAAFIASDQKNPPKPGQTLFIGSSTFTNWRDAQEYFPKHEILNRAFGGSRLVDVANYVDKVVYPYKPKQIVLYCGENDFAAEPKMPAYIGFERFKTVYALIRKRYPTTPFVYCSMKPSPSREHLTVKFMAANRWIKAFLASQPHAEYLDMWPVMIDEHGRTRTDIFTKDMLHMNADGYKLWAPIIEQALK